MRQTVWTLLLVMLLQLVLGSAWAMRSAPAQGHAGHCHEAVAIERSPHDAHHPQTAPDKVKASSIQGDSHHCCAIGLGVGTHTRLAPLPQAVPCSMHGSWISQRPRPDLRPPI